MVVTDYFVNGYSWFADPESWDVKMDVFIRDYHAAKEAGDEMGLKVYWGLEYTADRKSGEDYLLPGLKEEHLYHHLRHCDQWPPEQVIDMVHDLGGIVIRAHLYREANYIQTIDVERPGLKIDAVEAFNGGNSQEIHNARDPADYAAICAAIKNGDAAILHQPRKK